MPRPQWLRPPRHLLVLFLAVTAVPAAALAWLSWRLLEQDRALENQRIQERLEHAADLIATALDRRLSELWNQLPTLDVPAEDALLVTLRADQVEARPRTRLLYYPQVPQAAEAPLHLFEAGENLEFRQGDFAGAIAEFRRLARSREEPVCAGALMRLGRTLRKNGQLREALAVYDELAQLGPTPVGDTPADLLARQARCAVLKELNQSGEVLTAANSLFADLQRGRWQLDRISYQFHSQEARQYLGSASDPPRDFQDSLALAAAVESLWEQWQQIEHGEGSVRGHRSVWVQNRSVLLIWNGSPGRLEALVAGPRYLESKCRSAWQGQGVVTTLVDSDAHSVLDHPVSLGQPQAVRPAAETRLPWTLRVASADPAADLAQLASRRLLLLGGLAIMGVLLVTGGYFTARAATRELAVARLQSDFVSAVSHEFRTPLTSMRHLTELLDRGVVSGEDRRHQYYAALSHETARLHRLVESLLNFGRMEAGALEYRFEPANLSEFLGEVITEFQQESAGLGHPIEFTMDKNLPELRIDREALARALWNLLDNAAKYSPDGRAIHVDLSREGEHIAIGVRDAGQGIPAAEQKEIFKKFVRGAAARASSVRGTGVGLAMVQHAVRAHSGEIKLESRPGEGSKFTILLPVEGRTK